MVKKKWLILFNVALVTFICCVDSSSVNVALPIMAKALGVGMASIEWVVTINLLVIICFILVFGRLGDIKGKDLVFKWGIGIFLVGSLICCSSQNFTMLIIGRMVEGFGASATMANSQGIIAQVFPSTERGRALGISGSCVALGTMLGPAVGGIIITHFSWNMIFMLNVPLALISLLLSFKLIPKMAGKNEAKLDIKGSLLFMVFITTVYMGVKFLQGGNEAHLWSVVAFGMAFIMGIIFMRTEKNMAEPMLELSLFKNKLFSVSVFCAFLSFFALSCNNFIQPFYLQKVLGISPAMTGMILMVYPIFMSIIAPCSGYLSDKIGSEMLGFIGLATSSTGLLVLSFLSVDSTLVHFMLGVALMAVGTGLFQSPNTSLIMSTVPKDKLGVAGSINGLVRNLGMIFGISLSTMLLYNLMSMQLGFPVTDYIDGRGDVFVYGMRWVYRFASAICFVGVILTGLRWREKRGMPTE